MTATIRPAAADQQYDVRGEDVYRVGASAPPSRVAYSGAQRLLVERDGHSTQYEAEATYTRDSDGVKRQVDAHFVQELLPNGSFEDRVDDDPDFLTVLNQPFAVRLDATTLRDLRGLHSRVPFDASSPVGGQAVLRGFLRPAKGGKIHGRATVAVAFEADGPMTAPMPSHTSATMSGRMRMDGTAYYSLDDAMLQALEVRLTIVAQLHDGTTVAPVRIVYRRFIRAAANQPDAAKTPRPTPLPSDGGTEPPATR
ncbi:MAG TPA: hypothetical protein VGF86_10165 [Candidatus Tumulicola sp.]